MDLKYWMFRTDLQLHISCDFQSLLPFERSWNWLDGSKNSWVIETLNWKTWKIRCISCIMWGILNDREGFFVSFITIQNLMKLNLTGRMYCNNIRAISKWYAELIWFNSSRIKFVWNISFEDHGRFLASSEPKNQKKKQIGKQN